LVGPRWLVGWSIRWLVSPHITSKASYVAIASRRGEGRGNQLISKTGYIEIASRLVTVHPFLFIIEPLMLKTTLRLYDTLRRISNCPCPVGF
jgi:hypothetical protein